LLDIDGVTGTVKPESFRTVEFDEELYVVQLGANEVFETPFFETCLFKLGNTAAVDRCGHASWHVTP